MDNYSTPQNIVSLMIDAVKITIGREDVIADFAAGEGTLLKAANIKWPKAKFVASDVDLGIIRFLKKQNRNWQVCKIDFLNSKSISNSPSLRSLIGKTKLILINPPFSCRGGKKY